jgi:hypothetical protein
MAYEEALRCLTLLSSGSHASDQYKIMAASTANGGEFTLQTTKGGLAVGVLQDNSTAACGCKIGFAGVTKVAAGNSTGAAISVGATLIASTLGVAVPSTGTNDFVVCQALEALSSGSTGVIAAQFVMSYLST